MRRALSLSLVASVLVHVISTWLLLSYRKEQKVLQEKIVPITVHLKKEPSSVRAMEARRISGLRRDQRSREIERLFKVESKTSMFGRKGQITGQRFQCQRGKSQVFDQKYAEGHGAHESFNDLESTQWLSSFYRRVQENLIYPKELARAQIQGEVDLEIRFSLAQPDGPEFAKIRSTSPYLRVLVMRTVKRVLEAPLPKDLQKLPKGQSVNAHFLFAITEPQSEDFVRSQQQRAGRLFVFYRQETQTRMEWKLGPLRGYYGIPAVSVDSDWVDEKLGPKRGDPLEPYRRDPEFIQES